MEKGDTVILTQDIHSHLKRNQVYGYKDERVMIVSTEHFVLIVENAKKQRFSVTSDKVRDENSLSIFQTDEKYSTKPPNNIPKPVQARRSPRVKSAPLNQNQLF